MKTRFFVTASLVFLVSTAIFADTKDVRELTEVGKFLERSITYPSSAINKNAEGTVSFTLTKNGENILEYKMLSSDNDMLSSYVVRRIKRLEPRLTKLMEANDEQVFRLTFKLD